MTAYQPASRRPIAGVFRRTAHAAVRFCVARGIHPDVISYASVVCAAGAAGCFILSRRYPVLLLVAPPLMWLRLYFNMLDGMVALESGKASRRGEIVNELPDRVSDVLIFAGLAHSGLAGVALAYWAGLLAVMTAYVGTLAQAVTGKRRFEGVMSKQWRMIALGVGALVAFGLITVKGTTRIGRLSVLDWTNVVIVAGCGQTCYVRLRHALADLRTAGDVSTHAG